MYSLQTLAFLGAIVLTAGYFLYRWALPRPIIGIPHNERAAKSILGDAPEALAFSEHSEIVTWMKETMIKLDSPMIQVFMKPLAKPWVIVADYREAQDVTSRRTREFDRSDWFGDLFTSLIPHNQVHMKTGDEWKEHRRLMADTMSFSFLNDVAGPRIYEGTLTLLRLWQEKARLADGRPFSAAEDIKQGAFEVVWAATFGSKVDASKTQADLLAGVDHLDFPKDTECEVKIPQASPPETFKALQLLSDSVTIPLNSLWPAPHHRLALAVMPKYRKALAIKNRLIDEGLDAAWQKFKASADDDDAVKSAVDLIVQREVQMANKENRTAVYNNPVIRDELYGFLSAGFDTSSSTLEWVVKFLTNHQEAQKKLREELFATFPGAKAEGRNPSASELAKTKLPYLAACMEESHRLGGVVSLIIRSATQDAELLGRVIPKGTDVFFITQGPGHTTKIIPVDEKLRSTSSRESKGKNNEWDSDDIEAFLPERWLVKGEAGETVFDPRAGPDMPFGSGTRGCFGRRLAELELKIMVALIIWNFNLDPTPAAMSTYIARHDLTRVPRQCYLRLSAVR